MTRKLLFVVNVDWFFLSHRLPIALEAMRQGYEVHVATGVTDRLPELEAHGLVVHPLAIERGSTAVLAACITLWQIYQLCKVLKPDLVHLVTIKPVLLGGLAARIARVPAVVLAVSGLGFVFLDTGLKAKIRRFLVGGIYRMALGKRNIRVIFQNPDDQANVSRLAKLPECKTTQIRGSGVDLGRYIVRSLPEGKPIVILPARMLKDKGVREFVEAARLLKQPDYMPLSGVRCVLVGEPDPQNPASLTHEELGAWQQEGLVEVWGYRNDMSDVFARAHLVVLPSYREGLPKALIEAAACGRAVVTTDVPGCRDAIEAGITGLLVPPRTSESLAKAIKSLLDAPKECEAMGLAGRALAEKAFDIRAVVKHHMEIYDELLAKVGM